MAVFRAGIFNRYCYPLNMHVRDGRTPNPTIARHLKVEKFGVLPTKLIGHHLRFFYGWGNFKIDLTIQMVPHVPQPVGHHRPYKFYRVRIHALERVPHRMAGRAERWPGVANPGKSPLDPPTCNAANSIAIAVGFRVEDCLTGGGQPDEGVLEPAGKGPCTSESPAPDGVGVPGFPAPSARIRARSFPPTAGGAPGVHWRYF